MNLDLTRDLKPAMVFDGGLNAHLAEMLRLFVPSGGGRSLEDVEAERLSLKVEFMAFHTQTGFYLDKFDRILDPPLTPEDTLARQKTLTLEHVSQWVDDTGGHDGRLQWWSTFAATSPLYLKGGQASALNPYDGLHHCRAGGQASEE